jgi:hypothetical protein
VKQENRKKDIRKAGNQGAGFKELAGQAPPYDIWIPACAGMTFTN